MCQMNYRLQIVTVNTRNLAQYCDWYACKGAAVAPHFVFLEEFTHQNMCQTLVQWVYVQRFGIQDATVRIHTSEVARQH